MRLIAGVLCTLALCAPRPVAAQDLFELEVFEFETAAPGSYAVGIHTNGVPGSEGTGAAVSAHSPVHLSLEVTRGWTTRLDSALFVQTAPFGSGDRWFAGGHVRMKFALTDDASSPVKVALSGEYGFNRRAWDDELQTFEVTPILEHDRGRLSLIVNPSMELVVRGAEGQPPDPSLSLAARAAWRATPALSLAIDYFSRSGTTRHLEVDDPAHHLVFPTVEIAVDERWTMSLGAGHCVTTREAWVFRSILSYSFSPS